MTDPCDCYSYNRGVGTVPAVVLDKPEWALARAGSGISVDACIAVAVQALWNAGHITLASCCGHGGRVADRPNLVLDSSERDFAAIRAVIATVDPREFELCQWRLVEVS